MDGRIINTDTKPETSRKLKWIIGIVAVILVIAGAFIYGYGEIVSIKELGAEYLDVFIKNFTVKAVSYVVSFVLVFLIFYITTSVIKKICFNMRGTAMDYLEKKEVFDIVISDIEMEGVQGLEFGEIVRKKHPEIFLERP